MHGIPAVGPEAYRVAAHLDCLPLNRSTKPPKTPPVNVCDRLQLLAGFIQMMIEAKET